jgi:Arc/MetJ-type ribon-helix-helix transcriptional regulator
MATLNISLPEPLRTFVEAQASARGYPGPDEYVQSLIREAHQAHQRAEMEAQLLLGMEELDRGESAEMRPQDWERLRTEYQQRQTNRNSQ